MTEIRAGRPFKEGNLSSMEKLIQDVTNFKAQWEERCDAIGMPGNEREWARSIVGNFNQYLSPGFRSWAGTEKAGDTFAESRQDTTGYSSKLLDQTPQEFFADIDRVLSKHNIDPSAIVSDVREDGEGRIVPFDNFDKAEVLLPVYLELVTDGYPATDLSGIRDIHN